MTGPRNTAGARPIGDEPSGDEPSGRKRGLLWLLLALLALALLIVLLITVLSGDDDKDKSAKAPSAQSAKPVTGGAGASSGALTAGGQSLFPASAASLQQAIGSDAQGREVVVQSVVKSQGFWVGSSQSDRVYVEYGGNTGENEPGGQPKEGAKVNLTGPVKAAPADPESTLNVSAPEAEQIRSEGAYINADTVTPA